MTDIDEAELIMDTLAGTIHDCEYCTTGSRQTDGRVPEKRPDGTVKFITCPWCNGKLKINEETLQEYRLSPGRFMFSHLRSKSV